MRLSEAKLILASACALSLSQLSLDMVCRPDRQSERTSMDRLDQEDLYTYVHAGTARKTRRETGSFKS